MKITIVVTKFDANGGGEKFDILMTTRALIEMGHTVQVVTMFSELNTVTFPLSFKIREERVTNKGLLALQQATVRVLKKYDPETDIFYLIGTSFLFGAGWYRIFSRASKPVVAHLNGFTYFTEAYYRVFPLWPKKYLDYYKTITRRIKHALRIFLERTVGVFFVNQLDAITIMSPATANYYRRAGVKEKKISIMPSFHDIESLQAQPPQPNPWSGYPEGTMHFLSIGRIYIDKGVDLLIGAWKEATLANAILHIVGTGPQKKELEDFVHEHGLTSVIKFYPWQDPAHLTAFYQHADVFVYPGRLPESMVRTTVEAMALGIPVVGPDTSAFPWTEAVAKIFRNGDEHDLAQKLLEAYRDRSWRIRAGDTGKKLAQWFDYRGQINNLEKILKNVTL